MARLVRLVRPSREISVDQAPWDWYERSCPCGLPPGECREHPRARDTQRIPDGDWRVWSYIAGRGAGKTRAGAEWVQHRVKDGTMKLGCLIAPTNNDIRDVMVEGPSGLLNVAAPEWRPRFEPSKRRVTWPNGAWAVCLSGEEPERARVQPRHDLGGRAGVLAAGRIDMGTGDAGLADGKEPPGDDYNHAKESGRAQENPGRADDGADQGYNLREPGPASASVSVADRRPL